MSTTADDSAGTELAPLTTSTSLPRAASSSTPMPHTYRARVSQIDVVGSRFDACLRDGIVLSLERTRRVNDDAGIEPPQLCRKVCRSHVERHRFGGNPTYPQLPSPAENRDRRRRRDDCDPPPAPLQLSSRNCRIRRERPHFAYRGLSAGSGRRCPPSAHDTLRAGRTCDSDCGQSSDRADRERTAARSTRAVR